MAGVRDKSTQAVIDAAAEWVVRLSAADVSLEDKREFVEWLKRSPVHLGEYLRIERTWSDLGRADPAQRLDLAELLAADDANVVELEAAAKPVASPIDRVKPRARGLVGALAAGVMMALAGTIWFHLQFANRYSTGVGEQRTIKLDDGSTVVLNTHTRLQVDFSSTLRLVRLQEGEALFNVAKDASRPFRVLSEGAVAQAVGTSFIVRQKAQQTVVTVIEGRVAVAHSVPAQELKSVQIPEEAIQIAAGVRADVAERAISTSMVENPSAVTAWRSGRLVFDGETLAEAVAEFNRYNELHIVLQDSRLSAERLSGVFDADQPQALVRFLERSGVIESAQKSGSDIILVPRR